MMPANGMISSRLPESPVFTSWRSPCQSSLATASPISVKSARESDTATTP